MTTGKTGYKQIKSCLEEKTNNEKYFSYHRAPAAHAEPNGNATEITTTWLRCYQDKTAAGISFGK